MLSKVDRLADQIAEQRGLVRDLTTVLGKRNDELADLRRANAILHALLSSRDHDIGVQADEIARLRAERDQFERDAGRLRLAAYEATTNGRWTEGEQCGEWAISAEVYETLRDAIAVVLVHYDLLRI